MAKATQRSVRWLCSPRERHPAGCCNLRTQTLGGHPNGGIVAAVSPAVRKLVRLLVVTATASALTSCGDDTDRTVAPAAAGVAASEQLPASHLRMVRTLAQIAARTEAENHYQGAGRYEALRARLQAAGALAPWQAYLETGKAALEIGREREGIELLTRAYTGLRDGSLQGDVDARVAITYSLAVGWLRLAETENCCARPDANGCILPIEGTGIHSATEGSVQATRYLEEMLAETVPDSYWHFAARWLFNLAQQTLGKWPTAVPEALRLPDRVFRPDPDQQRPKFPEVARQLGLDTFSLSGGVVADDFDGDGLIDLMVSSWDTRGQLRLHRNVGDGSFEDVTEAAGLIGLFGGLNLVQADYDNDGDVDVLVLRGAWLFGQGQHPNSLLQNDGKGRFTDVTFDAGLGGDHRPTQTADWADYDGDGDLDLYIGNEGSQQTPFANQLFRNDGDGTFTDVAQQAGVADPGFTKAVAFGDYDGDGFADLYVSNLGNANRLYRNLGDGTFVDVAPRLGVTEPIDSFPCWWFDYDNDGDLDLYASCYGTSISHLAAYHLGKARDWDLARLYRNDGKGGFEDVAVELGLTCPQMPMGCNFGDLDGDGWLDFVLGTGSTGYDSLMPNAVYQSQGGKRFVDIALDCGFAHLQKGHGVAFADLDRDGDLDLFQQMGGAYRGDAFRDALFENPGFGNRWITIELVGTQSNRSAIGARICVDVVAGGARRSIFRWITSGGSFGASPLAQTIGLGRADKIVGIEIRWPRSSEVQRIEDAQFGTSLRVTEGRQGLETRKPAPIQWRR